MSLFPGDAAARMRGQVLYLAGKFMLKVETRLLLAMHAWRQKQAVGFLAYSVERDLDVRNMSNVGCHPSNSMYITISRGTFLLIVPSCK
jgi:hypothetical protein